MAPYRPQADRPEPRTREPRASRGLRLVVGAFVTGLLCFVAVWLGQRREHEADVSAPAAAADGQVFAPLPAPALPGADGPGRRDRVEPLPAATIDAAPVAEVRPPAPAVAWPDAPPVAPAPAPAAPAAAVAPPLAYDTAPVAFDAPPPRYPAQARRRGEAGEVLLRVTVDAAGRPESVGIARASGSRALDRAAVEAVRRWRFQPAMQGEVPVAAEIQIPIQFTTD